MGQESLDSIDGIYDAAETTPTWMFDAGTSGRSSGKKDHLHHMNPLRLMHYKNVGVNGGCYPTHSGWHCAGCTPGLHSAPSSMKRLLRTAGADPTAIAALDHFRCPVCENAKMPARAPATKMPSEYRLNEEIAIDTFVVKDMSGAKFKIFSIVDMGTLFHVAGIVGQGDGPPSSAEFANLLNRSWLSWAGAPRSVIMDRGMKNRGRLQGLLRAHGTVIPNQLGRGERQGGILKELIQATVISMELNGSNHMEFAVTESATIKNHKINHRGFVPSPWVLGYLPREIDSLTALDPQEHVGQHEDILEGTSSFARQMAIRASARESLAQLDSAQRIRPAMLRKTTATRGPFHTTGDLNLLLQEASRK